LHWAQETAAVEPAGQKFVPAVHAETVLVAGFGQKLPTGHWVHAMLEVTVQTDDTYWPDKHEEHVVQTRELAVVE
jgi:hypothetical protein